MIGVATRVGDRPFRVTFQTPGPGVPDGDGGSTESWIDLTPPAGYYRIVPATGRDLERVAAGTVLSSLSRLMTGPYHPEVTPICRGLWTDLVGQAHVANVTGVSPNARSTELELVVVEVVS